jgi:hypothetical protein
MTTVIKPKRSTVAASIPTSGQLEIGELAINIPDGKLYTKDSAGTIKELGGAGSVSLQTVTNTGAITTNDITLNGANLIFEGLVANAFETTLTVDEPTADRTISLPNITGTVITTGNLSSITSTGTLTGLNISSSNLNLQQNVNITFEGATDDSFETTLTVLDPTADRTINLPNQSGVLATDGDALAYSIAFGN